MVVTLNDVYLITDTDFMKALNDFEAFVPEFVFSCHFEFGDIHNFCQYAKDSEKLRF